LIKTLFFILCFTALLFSNDCKSCHESEYKKCINSSHFTLKNVINKTKIAWGVAETNQTLQTLPSQKTKISKVGDLLDDLLRRDCLRCHLNSPFVNKSGNLCLACHKPHENKKDFKIAKATASKCLKCHNNNFTGSEFLGLFPKDFDKSYRAPLTKDGFYPKQRFGIDHHHLSIDLHKKLGFDCISCHKGKEWQS